MTISIIRISRESCWRGRHAEENTDRKNLSSKTTLSLKDQPFQI